MKNEHQKLKYIGHKILVDPIEVDKKLDELGWAKNELVEVATSMLDAQVSRTANDPRSAAGQVSWIEGTRRLREIGIKKGLKRQESKNVPWLVDTERCLQFRVLNSGPGTGKISGEPQNRTQKGRETQRTVLLNRQLLEIPNASLLSPEIPNLCPALDFGTNSYFISWFLLVFSDGVNFGAELSCPIDFFQGYFTDYSDRILLIDKVGVESKEVVIEKDIDDEIQVAIERIHSR